MKKEKKIVLLVDDSILMLERMIPMLKEMDNIHFVAHAGSYKEAVSLVYGLRPDMVLLDINLPDKSGIEVLKKIKELDQNIMVFMLTNQVNDYYEQACKKMGAEFFFDKSGDLAIISETISCS